GAGDEGFHADEEIRHRDAQTRLRRRSRLKRFPTSNQAKEYAMQVQPYLQFDGRCEEALEFYKTALGAKVEAIMRFKDGPDCMEMPQGTFARASRTSRASR